MCGASSQGEKLAGIFRLLIGTPGSCIIYRDNPGKNGMVGRYAFGWAATSSHIATNCIFERALVEGKNCGHQAAGLIATRKRLSP